MSTIPMCYLGNVLYLKQMMVTFLEFLYFEISSTSFPEPVHDRQSLWLVVSQVVLATYVKCVSERNNSDS